MPRTQTQTNSKGSKHRERIRQADYRQHPYVKPALTEEQKQKVHDRMTLMTRKGVYPYEYFDSWERFNEETLPAKEMFYSKLNDSHVNDRDSLMKERKSSEGSKVS